MSFLTSAWDLPQKLQSVMLVGRAMFDLGNLSGGFFRQTGNFLARLHHFVHQP
jgi:hypothetical protein